MSVWTPWNEPRAATAPPAHPAKLRKRNEGVTLRAVRPNVGLRVRYRRALERLVAEMHTDVQRTIEAAYAIAHDASPAIVLQGVMRRLGARWTGRFDIAAQELAAYFAKTAQERADGQLEAILRKAGLSVPFRLTPAVRDAVEAAVAENVTLIKSIASNYLTQVEGHVMRSVSVGRDLGPLAKTLEHQYGVTRRRAALISRDQSNKATAVIVRERQSELGLKAIWVHSAGGKTPRPTHVANSGREYDPVQGWFDPDVGERIWPGTLISCRCVTRSVIPGLS
jgi:uncharacterized protein with gpF-like domain